MTLKTIGLPWTGYVGSGGYVVDKDVTYASTFMNTLQAKRVAKGA